MKKSRMLSRLLPAAIALALPLFGLSAHAQAVLINDGFEVNYDGWAEVGELTALTAHGGAAYNSGRGMEVTGRKLPADGAFSEKGFYLDGGEIYDYSVFVRHGGKAAETFNLTLRWLLPDGITYGSEIIASAPVPPNQWTALSSKYTAPKGSVNLTVFINTNSTVDFCFDQFTVTGRANDVLKKSTQTMAEAGLKDVFAKRFHNVGTCIPASGVNNSTNTALILREFNSLTPENELKPDATIQQSGSTNTDVRVTLQRVASILNFAVQNNLAVRGHTLVWHSQTPGWFFREGFQASGAVVSVAVMDQRMESYIKNMFAAIQSQYPALDLYSYDVVNEAMSESGGPRPAGTNAGDGQSMWVQVYGNNSFVRKAFVFARQYAPTGCKLYYNDYNEYIAAKRDGIISTIVRPLFQEGLLDAMGMQSHLDVRDGGSNAYPGVSLYGQAIDLYAAIGCELQVTELDATVNNQNFTAQATYYRDIMNAILTRGSGAITGVTIWGTMDNMSWRSSRHPLLFTNTGAKKPAYDAIVALIPESEWGDGSGGVTTVEPDANGFFFYHPFEDGTTQGWTGRGDAAVQSTTTQKANGTRSLAISGRAADWHGAAFSLDARAFVPGKEYSFSVMAMQNTGSEAEIKLTLQYSLDGEPVYGQVALIPAAQSGQWVQLYNTDFLIPAGATGLLLYVEMPGSQANFFIDDAMGGIAEAKIGPDGTPGGTPGTTSVQAAKNNTRGNLPLMTVRGRTLAVNASPDSKVRIRVVNMTGRTVASFNVNGAADVSLRKIPAGMYLIEAKGVKNGARMTSPVVLK